ncbi:MAG: hypothetical protein NZ534_03910, partial [Bacteroidia bacterium]|nr:hypothetical protein [Bacteroidia bacterium]
MKTLHRITSSSILHVGIRLAQKPAFVAFAVGVVVGLSSVEASAQCAGGNRFPTYETDGPVYVGKINNDKLFLGGGFSHIYYRAEKACVLETNFGVPLNLKGGNFPEFLGGEVYAIEPAPGGGWFVGGSFNQIRYFGSGAVSVGSLVRLNADGSLAADVSLSSGGTVYDLEYNPADDALYVGGSFTTIGGQSIAYLAKLGPTLAVDAAWNPGVDGAVHAVKTATISGTPFIFVGGTFANAGGNAHQNLAKINRSTAASVASWKPDPNYVVRAIDWHSDEGLFVGGDFTNISGQFQPYFARLNEVSGNLTAGFSPSFNEKVRAIRIVSAAGTGKVLVGGDFFIVNGATRRGFVSLNTADGSNHTLDAGLNTDAEVHAIALDGDNNLYLGGKFTDAQGKDRAGLVKLAADGLVIDEWVSNVPGVETVRALAITQERLFVAQTGDKFAYHSRQRFAIVDLAGQFVLPTPDFNGDVHALAFDPNVIYVGGAFTHYGNSRLARIGVVNNQLVLDGSWPQEGPQDVVRAIDLTSSHVYIGGDFTTVGTTSRSYLARISKTAGLLDQTWTPSVNNTVRAVLAQGSRVYVGGDFTAPQNRLAAIKVVDGTHDATFDISANGRVNALAFDGSTMYFAGEFSQVTDNSIPAGRVAVAAFDPATNTVWWWDPGPWTTSIKDLHVAAGRLYAAHYNDPADFCLSEMQLHPATPVTPHRLGVIAASTDRANYIAFWG